MVDIENQKAKQRKGKQHRNALNLPVFLVFLSFELLPQIGFVREIDPRVSKQRQSLASVLQPVRGWLDIQCIACNSSVEILLEPTGTFKLTKIRFRTSFRAPNDEGTPIWCRCTRNNVKSTQHFTGVLLNI